MTGRAAILGLGGRGSRWAETCLSAGWDVTGFDPDDRKGQDISSSAAWRREKTISGAVKSADVVICCLPDRLELLQPVLKRAQASAAKEAILAVVTKAFDIDDVQACAIRPAHVVRVSEGQDGALALDVSLRTNAETRDRVTEAMAVFGAAMSVTPAKTDNEMTSERRKA